MLALFLIIMRTYSFTVNLSYSFFSLSVLFFFPYIVTLMKQRDQRPEKRGNNTYA